MDDCYKPKILAPVSDVRMEKYSVLGELLYIGFVCEKGRSKESVIWKRSYTKSVKKKCKNIKMDLRMYAG